MRFVIQCGARTLDVEVEERADRFLVTIDGERLEVDARLPRPGAYSLLIDGVSHFVEVREENGQILVQVGGESYRLGVEEEFRARLRGRVGATSRRGEHIVRAPMPGRVVSVLVGPGDRVEAGAGLIIIEAMKMENELRAVATGEVKEIRVADGDAVSTGQVLLVIE
jgi:biotin carboxyl carrier protein